MITMRDVKQEETKLEKMVADFVVNQMKMSFEKGVVFGKQKDTKSPKYLVGILSGDRYFELRAT